MAESQPELFLDRARTSWEHNVQRCLCEPARYAGNPIVIPEHPWESGFITFYGTVLPREDSGGYRMWYQALPSQPKQTQFMCCAESDDGYRWRKTMSAACPYGERSRTNIVLGAEANVHGPCVLRNAHSDDPDERYLVFYDSYTCHRPDLTDSLQASRWTYTAVSPDGIAWSPPTGSAAVAGKSDTGNSVVWDPRLRRYIAYMRGTRSVQQPFDSPHGETTRVRYVRVAVSNDFLHWSEPVELLRADSIDGDPAHQFHQLTVTRRGPQFIGLLSIFHIDRYERQPDFDFPVEIASCDTQLIASRDGLHWTRVADRQVFIPNRTAPAWDAQFIRTGNILFEKDRMLFYYSGSPRRQSEGRHESGIGVAELPLDRFQSLRPRRLSQPAVLETKPLELDEGDLRVNVDARHGTVLAELCDFNGVVLDGFGKADCAPIKEDSLDCTVRWNGRKLSDAVDKDKVFRRAIRIRFYVHNAALYAAYIPCVPPWTERVDGRNSF